MSEMTHAHREKLMSDLRLVVADAEELLAMTRDEVSDKAAEVCLRMQARIEQAKDDLAGLQQMALGKARDAGRVTDSYVHDHPWTAMGIGAGVGMLLGMLISRR